MSNLAVGRHSAAFLFDPLLNLPLVDPALTCELGKHADRKSQSPASVPFVGVAPCNRATHLHEVGPRPSLSVVSRQRPLMAAHIVRCRLLTLLHRRQSLCCFSLDGL